MNDNQSLVEKLMFDETPTTEVDTNELDLNYTKSISEELLSDPQKMKEFLDEHNDRLVNLGDPRLAQMMNSVTKKGATNVGGIDIQQMRRKMAGKRVKASEHIDNAKHIKQINNKAIASTTTPAIYINRIGKIKTVGIAHNDIITGVSRLLKCDNPSTLILDDGNILYYSPISSNIKKCLTEFIRDKLHVTDKIESEIVILDKYGPLHLSNYGLAAGRL